MEHQKKLVSEKYEQSYSLSKSIENPDFQRSEAPIVCEIYDFDENLSKINTKILNLEVTGDLRAEICDALNALLERNSPQYGREIP